MQVELACLNETNHPFTEINYLLWRSVCSYAVKLVLEDKPELNYLCNSQLEISLTITNNTQINKLNKQWRGVDAPTNVLSMSMIEDGGYASLKNVSLIPLGDIIISLEQTAIEAKQQKQNFNEHFMRLLIHGTLHLMGLEHKLEGEAAYMHSLEKQILTHFKYQISPLTC